MNEPKPLLIRGRDMTVPTVNTIKDNTYAIIKEGPLNVGNSNVGRNFPICCEGVYDSTGAGPGYLILAGDNGTGPNQLKWTTPGLIPDLNLPRHMYVTSFNFTYTTPTIQIKCYGVDLKGYEKIFYMSIICDSATKYETAYTGINSTGDSFDISGSKAQLRHINWIETVNARIDTGEIKVHAIINGILTTLIRLGPTNIINPIYLCPYGRRTIIKGFNYMTNSSARNFRWILFHPQADGTGTFIIPQTRNFVPSGTITSSGLTGNNTARLGLASNGSLTIEGGYWCIFHSELITATSVEFRALCSEYKI